MDTIAFKSQIFKFMTVCCYHVTYTFRGESTLYMVAWASGGSLLGAGAGSRVYVTPTGHGLTAT